MSGWTNVRVEANTSITEELGSFMEGEYGERARTYADDVFQPLGYSGRNEREALAQIIIDEFMMEVERVAIICANDTSDSGVGEIYENRNGTAEEIFHKNGYDRARGSDVCGEMEDECGFSVTPLSMV